MEITDTKHPQQRRYCDRDDHGTGDDQAADRWCYDYHRVQMPRVPAPAAERPPVREWLAAINYGASPTEGWD
jgi:hypothetical protein